MGSRMQLPHRTWQELRGAECYKAPRPPHSKRLMCVSLDSSPASGQVERWTEPSWSDVDEQGQIRTATSTWTRGLGGWGNQCVVGPWVLPKLAAAQHSRSPGRPRPVHSRVGWVPGFCRRCQILRVMVTHPLSMTLTPVAQRPGMNCRWLGCPQPGLSGFGVLPGSYCQRLGDRTDWD